MGIDACEYLVHAIIDDKYSYRNRSMIRNVTPTDCERLREQ